MLHILALHGAHKFIISNFVDGRIGDACGTTKCQRMTKWSLSKVPLFFGDLTPFQHRVRLALILSSILAAVSTSLSDNPTKSKF